MNRKVIIQGSAKSHGNTNKVVSFVNEKIGADIIDLKTKNINGFDYEFKNSDDDFIPLIKEIAEKYDTLIFATPVYWYSMSGIMKTFFDRITDCLKVEKEVGKILVGKRMALISCGSDSDLKDGFTMPFIETANYFSMEYIGSIHTWVEDSKIPNLLKKELNAFAKRI